MFYGYTRRRSRQNAPLRRAHPRSVAPEGGGAHIVGRRGAILAYGAFEILGSAFTPTPTTPDRQHLSHSALSAPDAGRNGF